MNCFNRAQESNEYTVLTHIGGRVKTNNIFQIFNQTLTSSWHIGKEFIVEDDVSFAY